MSALYSELSWLPRTPEDFSAQCKGALRDPESLGARIRALASYGMDENQLIRLAKLISSARAEGKSLEPLSEYRLALISNATVDFIAPALTATAARYGIALECVTAGYDQAVQESLNPDSAINRVEAAWSAHCAGLARRAAQARARQAGRSSSNQSTLFWATSR